MRELILSMEVADREGNKGCHLCRRLIKQSPLIFSYFFIIIIYCNESLEEMDCFKYLGSQVAADGGCERDVHRMNEG